jgi:DNA-directed RNA polymerase specialized sigma subunit
LNGPQQSQREIGKTLGISRSAVGQRRENAVRRLRLMMRAS